MTQLHYGRSGEAAFGGLQSEVRASETIENAAKVSQMLLEVVAGHQHVIDVTETDSIIESIGGA